ncbi:MAG: Hsp70 family protein, partial [Planctomycetota bacterium]
MLPTHAVGIDLGTTYSCIAYLNEHGEPVTLANQEGELSTPSAVLFEPSGEIVVGTEALRHAVLYSDRVVMHAKRFMGDPQKVWTIDGRRYTPTDISALILRKLLDAAEPRIGKVDRAVITVPAQFSERQRRATVEAGRKAGLREVDIINEPVAAALCYVLGTEGLWFTELADEQRILVWDLGGGTFDLSLVRYSRNKVEVIATGGDLHLGGIDWNQALERAVRKQFLKDFGVDPGSDPASLQMLALEVETTKRSLSVRPRTALVCQHDGHRKVYQIDQAKFEKLTRELTERTAQITQRLLTDNGMGWAHVDVVLMTGGASRMPMVRKRIKELGGRTPNTSLSPDQSIAHGAAYYAGMLLTNSEFARSILSDGASERLRQFSHTSVNARALGILVRDTDRNVRFPHYLIPANTPLPAAVTERFGTVVPNQRRVNLQIIESDPHEPSGYARVGQCVIDELPPELPEGSEIAVTIRYDEQALVHVEAQDVVSGKIASVDIDRRDSVVSHPQAPEDAAVASPSAAPKTADD